MSLHRRNFRRAIAAAAAVSLVFATVSLMPTVSAGVLPAALALADGPGSITLHVQSARTINPAAGFVHQGDAVTAYKWLINLDDTGDPGTLLSQGTEMCLPPTAVPGGSSGADPNYADTCPWPSVRNTSGMAPIIAQGDETDLGDSKPLAGLPSGKYLISVTADGFKIDGEHFTVSGGSTTPSLSK